MTGKELKKLNRKQLLELLLAQTSRADELEAQLAAARAELEKREIKEMEAGSIAEAALRLNGVFEAAEAAAAQYLFNIKRLSKRLEYRADCSRNDAQTSGNQTGWLNILLENEQSGTDDTDCEHGS